MILMLCVQGSCGMDMMVTDIQHVPNADNTKVKRIYHVGCENLHKSIIEGELIDVNPESAERRVLNYLIEESERRYGKVISN